MEELPDEQVTEEAVNSVKTAKDCAKLMDMSVTMLGQAFNSLTYYRRCNALSTILNGDKSKVKDILKENKKIFQEDSSQRLFGEKV